MSLPPDEDDAALLSPADIQTILSPHSRRLAACVWPIWDRFLAIPEVDRFTYDLVAEANVLNRYMVDGGKREFVGVPGVQWFEENGFVLVFEGFPYGIDGQAAVRFKKLDGAGRSKNNLGTRRARAVRSNNNDLLEGIPPSATWVDVGYVVNGLRTGIAEVPAIRVVDTQFIMNFPREEGGVIILTPPLLPGDGSPQPRFLMFPRREQQGTPEDPTPEE